MTWRIEQGDVVDVCGKLAEAGEKFHAILCDPPYGLEFMGKEWDAPSGMVVHDAASVGGFQDGSGGNPFSRSRIRIGNGPRLQEAFRIWGEAMLPLLYPGALVLMFGGTRTWHRLACGMEAAGFQMWDTLMWLYGQGFPKAQDISKLIDKANGDQRPVVGARELHGNAATPTSVKGGTYGVQTENTPSAMYPVSGAASEESAPWAGHKTTALKPAWEPVLCFKKPLEGTYAEAAMRHGAGALNIDGGRVAVTDADSRDVGRVINRNLRREGDGWGFNDGSVDRPEVVKESGRYPANVVLDEESATQLDAQSGELTSGANPEQRHSDITRGIYGAFKSHDCFPARGAESGGASRFFYCAKASSRERNAGLDHLPEVLHGQSGGAQQALAEGRDSYQGGEGIGLNKIERVRNPHPTVKPIDLCRYLATLLLPPDSVKDRKIFVPFSGSGSEIIGCLQAGWDEVVGCDKDAEYGRIAVARVIGDAPLFNTPRQA